MLWVTGMADALFDYYHRRPFSAIRFNDHPRAGGRYPNSLQGNHGNTTSEYKRGNEISSKNHSSGAVWESRWTSWAVRPNEPSGFRGRKDLLNRASALVTTCPWYVNWHLRTLSINSSSSSAPKNTIVQELCESRGGRPGLSVLASLMVSVDVRLYWTMLQHWSQLVPNMSIDIRGH